MHANNEIGIIQDIKTIGELCKAYNAIYHSDSVPPDVKKIVPGLVFNICAIFFLASSIIIFACLPQE